MNKKAIAILGAIFILIIGILGVLIFSKYSGGEPEENILVDNQNQDSGQNSGGQDFNNNSNGDTGDTTDVDLQDSRFVKLLDQFVISPVLFFNGSGITYFDSSGRLFQADLTDNAGKVELFRERELQIPLKTGITKILWPSQGDNFIAEIVKGSASGMSYYNGSLGVYADLPGQITSLDWAPGGDKIMYIWLEEGNSTLNSSDPDSTNWQQVTEIWNSDNVIDISPDGLSILFYRNGNIGEVNEINIVTVDGQVWDTPVKDGYNLGVLWSPDSKKFLYGKRNLSASGFEIWVYDLTTSETKSLEVISSTDKAVWDTDSRTVYIAGKQAPSGFGQEVGSSEVFYKIDTLISSVEEFIPENQVFEAKNLFLSSSANLLFFTDENAGGLYYLDLLK